MQGRERLDLGIGSKGEAGLPLGKQEGARDSVEVKRDVEENETRDDSAFPSCPCEAD